VWTVSVWRTFDSMTGLGRRSGDAKRSSKSVIPRRNVPSEDPVLSPFFPSYELRFGIGYLGSIRFIQRSAKPPTMALPAADDPSTQVVVVVDPYSTGCLVAKEINLRGYPIVALWTKGFSEAMKTHVPQSCGTIHYLASVDEPVEGGLPATADALNAAIGIGKTVVCCLAGGEAGVDLADALSEFMGLLTNGTDIPNRRDKKIQQELIRSMGLRSVRQAGGDSMEQVETFLRTESYPIVLKPNESAGSDGVKLCNTYEEAVEHFEVLMKSQMVNGGEVPAVLCQEFLRGKEYVIDHVSRDGIHKTMMVWVYDACSPVPCDSPEAKVLIPYVRGVLDALGISNGPSHGTPTSQVV
jgi:Phosphoribosylglycinamide synthetase, ATP-grasp (A) domain